MASLRQALGLKTAAIRVVSTEETAILNKDKMPYYACKLKEPIMVRCSMDAEIGSIEVDEVYVLESALDLDWAGTPEEGMFMEGWVADLSKGHNLIALYQEKPISAWVSAQRDADKEKRASKLSERLAALRKK